MRFFDTNILVYAATKQDERKQKIAISLIRHALETNHDGCISSQVINEFTGVMLGKMKMSSEAVDRFLDAFRPLQACDITYDLVRHAIAVREECQLSYWDALIVSAAERCHCHEILTEDLNDGQIYRGMMAINPFK